jgi:hypothetical protein
LVFRFHKATQPDIDLKNNGKQPERLRQQNLINAIHLIPALKDKDGKVSTTRFWFASEADFNLQHPNSVFGNYWVSSKQGDPKRYSLIE